MATTHPSALIFVTLCAIAAACSSERTLPNDPQDETSASGVVDSATCSDFYTHVDGCYSDAGCPGIFTENDFVASCTKAGFSASELGEQASQACEDTIFFFCDLSTQGAGNAKLFASPCCKDIFSCPSDLVCEPLDGSDNQAGVCITASSSFPSDAPACSKAGDCARGFICVQGSTSSKCVQVCAP